MLKPLISISGHAVSILNVYETALTYMISVNTNDSVQHSEITFDHYLWRSMPKFLLMAGACTYIMH